MDSYTHFFVTCIFIWRLKIWDSLNEPQASSFGERNNINYCQLGLIFGCLLHWTHCWRFSMRLIAWLGRANKLSVQNKGAVFHRLNDRIRKSQIPLLPIHKTRGSKGKSCLYCSTFDICQLILVVPSYVAKVLVCNWKARWTGEHCEPLPFPLSLNPQAAQRCPKVSRKNLFVFFLGEILLDILCCMVIVAYIQRYPSIQTHNHINGVLDEMSYNWP